EEGVARPGPRDPRVRRRARPPVPRASDHRRHPLKKRRHGRRHSHGRIAMKKKAGLPLYVYLLAALVVLAVPPELRNDPRVYGPVLAFDVLLVIYLCVDIALWWRKFKRDVAALEARYGPEIYVTLLEVNAEARRKGAEPCGKPTTRN